MILEKIFPFLKWFDGYNKLSFKSDLIAGLTVALVLIPQSMAYAQLAGLPPYFGLYAALLPPMIAALFGSSRQLATGPVAVVSLMTASALAPLASPGSDKYIVLALELAITVGLFQLILGSLRLGLIVNFISHPVINGFTNAAAIIIATSQLSKFFCVSVVSSEHHYETVAEVIRAAVSHTHMPTLLIALLSIGLIWGIKKISPKLPYVLIAVVVTTLISWLAGFENNKTVSVNNLETNELRTLISNYNNSIDSLAEASRMNSEAAKKIEAMKDSNSNTEILTCAENEKRLMECKIKDLKQKIRKSKESIYNLRLEEVREYGGNKWFAPISASAGLQGKEEWRIDINDKKIDTTHILLKSGGDVIGDIPSGIPSVDIPDFNIGNYLKLLPFAIIISLLGFMEAIAIAKAMATKTGQRINPNRELIGQGLANIIGSMSKSYPVSGSFSRSAINLLSGAETGLSSVFTSFVVLVLLLFFTGLLYYLPQSVLAAVILMAVIGLVNIKGFLHAWKAKKIDGIILLITFASTLYFAPHLEFGIGTGVALSLIVYLYQSMRPKVTPLSRHPDGHLRSSVTHSLDECKHISMIRYEGNLFFANASYLEDAINKSILKKKYLVHINIVANGINDVDASGEEALSLLIDRLRSAGYSVSISGLNETVLSVLKRTHLYERIGEENIYPTMETAIKSVYLKAHQFSIEENCPLLNEIEKNL